MPAWLIHLLPWLLGGAGAALLAWLLSQLLKRLRKKEEEGEKQPAVITPTADQGSDQHSAPLPEEKERQVRQVLAGDPRIAQRLLRLAGMGHRRLPDVSADPQAVEQIARSLSHWTIEALRISSSQQDLKFDLKSSAVRQPVNYPTGDIEPATMQTMDQLPNIIPEQQMMDDDRFYGELAQGNLLVLQAHENIVDQKLLYILLDVSPPEARQ